MIKNIKKAPGFTLIELLVVIGIIAILAAVVIIAINPARQFAQARNSQRQSNIESILNGLGQNLADNKGILTGCPSIPGPTGTTSVDIGSGSGNVDLTSCLSSYLPSGVPMDPNGGTSADTKYQVSVTGGRYMVCAPESAETGTLNASILCVTR